MDSLVGKKWEIYLKKWEKNEEKKYGKSARGKNISQFNFVSALMERVGDPSIDVEYFYSFQWEF